MWLHLFLHSLFHSKCYACIQTLYVSAAGQMDGTLALYSMYSTICRALKRSVYSYRVLTVQSLLWVTSFPLWGRIFRLWPTPNLTTATQTSQILHYTESLYILKKILISREELTNLQPERFCLLPSLWWASADHSVPRTILSPVGHSRTAIDSIHHEWTLYTLWEIR